MALLSSVFGWFQLPFSLFGLEAARWAWLAIAAVMLLERALVKSDRPEFRSLVGILATALQVLLTKIIPLRLIPVVGPAIVRFFETVAGVDIDGDGKVGDATERASKIVKAVERVEGLPPGTVTKEPDKPGEG